jgi:hypothetical protein
MTNDGPQKDAAPHSTPGPAPPARKPDAAPAAWLPLTPRGVAAFASATFSRLFIIELIFALLAAGAVVWFIDTAWCPVVRQAIRRLPEQGVLRDGRLQLGVTPIVPAPEGRFLALTVDLDNRGEPSPFCDLHVKFRQENFLICGALGCLSVAYPKQGLMEFNRAALEPWWGAWEPVLLAGVAVATLVSLLLIWVLLATVYFIPARLAAIYTARKLTVAGSWRLAGAALMPGSLLLSAAIVLYGTTVLDGLGLAIMAVLHVLAGWIYLFLSPLFLPKKPYVPRRPYNPFHSSPPEPRGEE